MTTCSIRSQIVLSDFPTGAFSPFKIIIARNPHQTQESTSKSSDGLFGPVLSITCGHPMPPISPQIIMEKGERYSLRDISHNHRPLAHSDVHLAVSGLAVHTNAVALAQTSHISGGTVPVRFQLMFSTKANQLTNIPIVFHIPYSCTLLQTHYLHPPW